MGTIPMAVISEDQAAGHTIFEMDGPVPAIRGKGAINYACGNCGQVPLETVDLDQVRHIVVKCGVCKSFNEVPMASIFR